MAFVTYQILGKTGTFLNRSLPINLPVQHEQKRRNIILHSMLWLLAYILLVELIQHIPWHEWARPLTAWGIFILLSYTVKIALINLLSRQWIHNERMNNPLLRVPQIMEVLFDFGTLS